MDLRTFQNNPLAAGRVTPETAQPMLDKKRTPELVAPQVSGLSAQPTGTPVAATQSAVRASEPGLTAAAASPLPQQIAVASQQPLRGFNNYSANVGNLVSVQQPNGRKLITNGLSAAPAPAQQSGVGEGQGTVMDQYMAMAKKYLPDAPQVSGLNGGGYDFSSLVNSANARKIGQQRLGTALELAKIDATKAGTLYDVQQKQAESQRKDREEDDKKYSTFFTDKDGKVDMAGKAQFYQFMDTLHPSVKSNKQVTPEKLIGAFRSMQNTGNSFDIGWNRDVNRGLDFNRNLIHQAGGRIYEDGSDKSAGQWFVNSGQDPVNLQNHLWLSEMQRQAVAAEEAAKKGKAK